jgi:2-hydroxychromene-2-carboxylate isomerase
VLAAMDSEDMKAGLREPSAISADTGLVGAPTFVTPDGELFWGNDRLEDALDWAVRGTLRPNTQN